MWDEFLLASKRFFDSPDRIDDSKSLFSLARCSAPAGWTRHDLGVWVSWRPDGVVTADQGWKIHISSTVEDAAAVIDRVAEFCVSAALPFKFLRSRTQAVLLNSKYATRASSGKLLTVYPPPDRLRSALDQLARLTDGRAGPYVLSDLRWGPGPVYLRYGAFVERYCLSDDGQWVPALRHPDGRLVPDVRGPVFQAPPWLPVPPFVRACMEAAAAEAGDDLPYQVHSALHFSNGGGIYQAVDPATGQEVVLREARPHAGLDGDGRDAVTRLRRERDALRRLGGLPVAPRLLNEFTCWEHEFLAEELIEGDRLRHAMAARHPLIYPDPTTAETTAYANWAQGIVDRTEQAVAQLHARGLVHGDLHLDNIMVRPNGQVVLIDFEQSFGVAEDYRPSLGSAAFAASWSRTGPAVDRYALACLRLSLLFPFTQLIGLDPAKAGRLLDLACDRFPLPADFRSRVRDGLNVPTVDKRRGNGGPPNRKDRDAAAIGREDLIAAILAHATPHRNDRLFPGDPAGFGPGGLFLAHGAAGVLWALAHAGAPLARLADHVGWLVRAARRFPQLPPGLYEGAHGVAYTLSLLGQPGAALAVLDRVVDMPTRSPTLYRGLAGIGFALLHLAGSTGQAELRSTALGHADSLAILVDGRSVDLCPPGVGLLHGWSGIATFLVRAYQETGESRYLDAAMTAVRRDLDRCVPDRKGGRQVADGERYLLYLATGSGGIAIAVQDVLRHRAEPDLAAALDGIISALRAEMVMEPGLFEGRAGLLAVATYLAAAAGDRVKEIIDLHRHRLPWHAVDDNGHPCYPGRSLLRLSMDLATGNAGVLAALHAAELPQAGALPLMGGPCVVPVKHEEGGELDEQGPGPAGHEPAGAVRQPGPVQPAQHRLLLAAE